MARRRSEPIGFTGRRVVGVADIRFGVGRTVAYQRLARLVDHALLAPSRLVYGHPTLYTATTDGLAWVGMPQLHPARVGVATTRHLGGVRPARGPARAAECCEVWASRGCAPRSSRLATRSQAPYSATCRTDDPRLRRPDLVLFPDAALPVAVEVELSVKGSRRLEAICRAWARCRIVSEVRYYAPPHVERAVSRAVSSVQADNVIRILSIDEALKEAAEVRFAA